MSMQFELERMERLVQDVEKLRFSLILPVTQYKMKPGKFQDGHCVSTEDWDDCDIGTPWQGLDQHRWLRTQVVIPAEMDGQRVEFVLTTGREGQWDATNPQMLFYVDGRVVQGIDVNHREVTLARQAEAGRRYDIAILAYSGTVEGDLILRSHLAVLDEAVDKFYYDFSIPVVTARLIRKSDPDNCRRILQKLAPAAKALDLRKSYSPAFYRSIQEAADSLEREFYTDVNENAPKISAIGHTHIDIAWHWTVSQTREKVLRSFATVLRLMEQYPEYKFMSSQPILYQFVKEQAPEMYAAIKERIAEGRWEVDGAMWLESDCNLPSGESLVRQILKGRKFFLEEFGIESKSLWLPDVFGYSAAIPQILKKSGIPYFSTTKIAWNQYNQLPNDTFLWRGIDGSETFVFMPTTCDFDKNLGLNISFTDTRNTTTYTGILNPNMTLGTYHRFQNKDLTEDTLMLYGFGDGGGGPTKEMLENARRLRYGLPGLPRIELEFETAYLDRTWEKIAHQPEMPTWTGELYFEYHRGTYTSIGKIKRDNRKGEILCSQLETVASIAAMLGEPYPQEDLEACWDTLLLHQFHDIIPGSAIEQVYRESDELFASLFQRGNAALDQALQALARRIPATENGLLVVNTLGYRRSDLVEVPGLPYDVCRVLDPEGALCPMQYTAGGSLLFFARDIPPCGYRTFTLVPGPRPEFPRASWDFHFENDSYRAAFNQNMELTSLVEATTGGELLQAGRRGNALTCYEDRPMNWDNWDVDIFYRKKPYGADEVSPPQIVEQGPVRTVIRTVHRFCDSTVTQDTVLSPHLPRIDFRTEADWREHNVLLKAGFPVDVNTTRATYEIQFGNVERETTSNHSWDTAKFETCAHKWADLSEYGLGISLLNDCKYGHSIRDGEMDLTLIKAGTYPNENADIGEHRFTYSIYPHGGSWREAATVEQAYNLNVPLLTALLPIGGEGPLPAGESSFLTVSHPNCFVETIKAAEDGDGYILRMYENTNRRTDATLQFGLPFQAAWECDLMERNLERLELSDGALRCRFLPYEIKTFRLIP